jgi:hypothetical protein
MKKFTLKKKMIAGAAAAALTLGVGGAAIAYFTANGAGTGSGSVGTSSAVTITGTAATPVTPDGATSLVNITVTNPGSGAQVVGSVHLASVDSSAALCDTSAFTMADTAAVGSIAGGGSANTTGTLVMHDNLTNQNDCQGSTLTLHFTSN